MEKTVNVSVERIYRLDNDSALKGFADISLCDSVVLKGLRIVEGKKGLFVGMPQQLGKDGKWHSTIAITDESLKDRLNELILSAFEAE
jgi:stage V sporulation protein G